MAFAVLSNIGLSVFFIYVFLGAYRIYRFITFYFHVPAIPLQNYRRKEGTSWALISGSSGGIGFALADQLLSIGFGVIIFAHESIEDAETRLRKDHPKGNIRAFKFNCMTASVSDIQGLLEKVKDLPITVLINNVGGIPMSRPEMRPFADFDAEGIDNTIALNARFMTQLTRIMIPTLKANASPRSLIINLSSGGRIGMAYVSVYSATKAYNAGLSASLSREFRVFNQPIDSLAIVPGDVVSTGNRLGVTPGAPLAKQYAAEIVGRVDEAVRRKLVECTPYWMHALQVWALEWLPEDIVAKETAKVIEKKITAWEKEWAKEK